MGIFLEAPAGPQIRIRGSMLALVVSCGAIAAADVMPADHYRTLDADGDGRFSTSELRSLFERSKVPTDELTEDGLSAVLAALDHDHDGHVTQADLRASHASLAKNFTALDTNGDGRLSEGEHLAALDHLVGSRHRRELADEDGMERLRAGIKDLHRGLAGGGISFAELTGARPFSPSAASRRHRELTKTLANGRPITDIFRQRLNLTAKAGRPAGGRQLLFGSLDHTNPVSDMDCPEARRRLARVTGRPAQEEGIVDKCSDCPAGTTLKNRYVPMSFLDFDSAFQGSGIDTKPQLQFTAELFGGEAGLNQMNDAIQTYDSSNDPTEIFEVLAWVSGSTVLVSAVALVGECPPATPAFLLPRAHGIVCRAQLSRYLSLSPSARPSASRGWCQRSSGVPWRPRLLPGWRLSRRRSHLVLGWPSSSWSGSSLSCIPLSTTAPMRTARATPWRSSRARH